MTEKSPQPHRPSAVATATTALKRPLSSSPPDEGDDDIEMTSDTELTSSSPKRHRKICAACHDNLPPGTDHIISPCGHLYCHPCFIKMIMHSTTSESLFPPNCCGDTFEPEEVWYDLLTPSQLTLYKSKREEYSVIPKKRLYCPSCGTFQPQARCHEEYTWKVTCVNTECGVELCLGCKHLWHDYACDIDEQTKEYLDKCRVELGWKVCYRCDQVIENVGDCDDMWCRCSGRFCYNCGQPKVTNMPVCTCDLEKVEKLAVEEMA